MTIGDELTFTSGTTGNRETFVVTGVAISCGDPYEIVVKSGKMFQPRVRPSYGRGRRFRARDELQRRFNKTSAR